MKIQKKNIFFLGGGGVRVGGGQGGCELRSEAFVNIQKKKFFLGGGRSGRGGGVGSGLGGGGRVGFGGGSG